ncbi:MAG: hypothetical protein HKO06_01195 [Pseudomonadales bacterium]|nr:hypothetical protein [Pseudomonadales bacterium]
MQYLQALPAALHPAQLVQAFRQHRLQVRGAARQQFDQAYSQARDVPGQVRYRNGNSNPPSHLNDTVPA